MTKRTRKVIRYSTCFKQNVVRSIEQDGMGINQARLHYGIKGTYTVQNWLKKFGRNDLLNKIVRVESMNEKDELKRLREENKRLKIAYAELSMEHKLSECVIETADEMLDLDLKKKYAAALSKNKSKPTA